MTSIPRIVTRKNAAPLLRAIRTEAEFQPGFRGRPNPQAWYRRRVRLEFPTGELVKDMLTTLALVGASPYSLERLTGKERFTAQGLEGKVVVEKDLFSALMNLTMTLPEHHGRAIVAQRRRRRVLKSPRLRIRKARRKQ